MYSLYLRLITSKFVNLKRLVFLSRHLLYFTKIDFPFKEPNNADIIVENDKHSVEESKAIIHNCYVNLFYFF